MWSAPVLISRGLDHPLSGGGGVGSRSLSLLPTRSAVLRVAHPFLVAIAAGSHPFPSRTRKLRPPAPMVLPLISGGRVGRRQDTLQAGPVPRCGTGPAWLSMGE